jgi:hypothetical protein
VPALPRDGDPGQEQDGYPGTGENPPVEARFVSEIPEPSLQDDIGGRSGDRERRDVTEGFAFDPQGLAYDLLGRVVSQRFKSLPVDHVFFLQVCGFLVVG